MRGRKQRISAEQWVTTARQALVEEGFSGVKVDRLAQRLGVTRGGFFHNFRDREALLERLIEHWRETCRFFPADLSVADNSTAREWLRDLANHLIDETHYDHRFDMAMREWARSDPRARIAVDQMDADRLKTLEDFYKILGYSSEQSTIRARIFYYHQIGYYAIEVEETRESRRARAELYLDILCGV